DADKEGFLRSKTSLIQTCGRAARNVDGRVILYADKVTESIEGAMGEMERRRTRQHAHNEEHGIVPRTIVKPIRDQLEAPADEDAFESPGDKRGRKGKRGRGKGQPAEPVPASPQFSDHKDLLRHIKALRAEMMAAAKNLDFELAARIRDEVFRLEQADMELL
ncbi:MAG: UvrB/UvrC motif-containing protein, partial [Planctomycetes bacterium]|nr:UvrB/UvrC motif-containing protein [Planctomycetota bacterium]